MTVANSNIQNRTWLTRPLTPTDTLIYVNDVSTLVDVASTVADAVFDSNSNKIYSYLNYNIIDIVLLTVNNLTTGLTLAKASYYLNTVNSTTQVIFTAGVEDGDALEFVLRFGNTIIINGEKIMFKNIDVAENTISNFIRGADGTAVSPTHSKYSYVLSFSTKDILNPFYNNKVWNSDDYSADGDPLQLSNTVPANFLKSD